MGSVLRLLVFLVQRTDEELTETSRIHNVHDQGDLCIPLMPLRSQARLTMSPDLRRGGLLYLLLYSCVLYWTRDSGTSVTCQLCLKLGSIFLSLS